MVALWNPAIKAICQILEKGLKLYDKELFKKYPITLSEATMADRQKPRFSKERWGFYFRGTPEMAEKLDPSELVSFISQFDSK